MRGHHIRSRRFARSVPLAMVACGLFVIALAASAATLGGISAQGPFVQEESISIDIPPPPGPLVHTDFSGCSNTLDGWTDESGAVWISHSGNWQCLGSEVVRAQQRVNLGNATVDISPHTSDIRISTTVDSISNQNNRSGPGLALLRGTSGFLYVMYERDQQRLNIGVSGQAPFAEVNDVGDFDTATITAELTGTSLRAGMDTVMVGPFDLATYAPQLLANTRFGLVSDNDNQSRFGTFTIELLP
jgi:hypothetical protein